MKHMRKKSLFSSLLVSAATLAACSFRADAFSTQAHAQPIHYPPAVSPVQSLAPLQVSPTSLSKSELQSDIQNLSDRMAGHTGDGAVRGPDQLVYNIDVRIDPISHEYAGHLSLHLHNNLGTPTSKLYFNVWPDSQHYVKAGSSLLVQSVRVEGVPAKFTLQGTILTVSLSTPLRPNGSAEVSMDFLAKLPHIQDRFGYEDTTVNFGNWFPMLAVHDNYGWVTPPYYNDGESFYSLTGTFHLQVTAPRNLVLAISGEPTSPDTVNQDGTVTYHYQASAVRDVAMVGNTKYQVLKTHVLNTDIYTYYAPSQKNQAQLMASTAAKAISTYSKWYGPYPYQTLRVCPMTGWFGGMEYPQLVMISFPQDGNSRSTTISDVAHEVAHQWFFSMVGDDQFLTPWIDEAFATFSEERLDHLLSNGAGDPPVSEDVSSPVSAFPDSDFYPQLALQNTEPDDYYTAVYDEGSATLYDLMQRMGQVKFDAMMRGYFRQYQYQVATTKDFIDFVSKSMHKDMTRYFADHGIRASDDLKTKVQPWVTWEEGLNGRNWH